MKKYYYCFVLLYSILFLSCEENVNPFDEYQERYVFNCILRGDTLLQVAAVAKTYREGFDAAQSSYDPFISGADVRVSYRDSVYRFYDTSVVRSDTSRFKSPMNVYLNRRFKIEPNQQIEVEVMIPNGRRLKSSTKTVGIVSFLDSSTVLIYNDLELLNFLWTGPSVGSNYFLPNFSIIYYKKEGNHKIRYKKDVPLKYENNKPVQFSVSKMPTLSISNNTVKQAIREISEGDPDKASYSISLHPEFLVAAFDDALSKYYSTSTASFSSLTVTLDESDYSNIQGGYGIFGSFTSSEYQNLKFSREFITSFGYTVEEK